jgi:EmrB/QacA subfamily drug resistance transporter
MANIDDTGTTAPSAAPPDPRRWQALAVIAVGQLIVSLDATVVTIALPWAQRGLHISVENRQWVVTAYTLAFGGLLLLGGRIADFMGRKRVLVVGLVGFAVASAVGGAAQSAAMLFIARACQGGFAALLAPAGLALITVTFVKPAERAKAFGVYGAISAGGAAIGLVAGGVLTEYASWRWCLLVNVPIALLAALFALRLVKESKSEGATHYDVPGVITATAGLVALVYGFTKATVDGWGAPTTVGFLVAAVVLLGTFVVIEQRTTYPLLPLWIVLDWNRSCAFLLRFLAAMAMFGMFLFLTFDLQTTLHYSALVTGFAFVPFNVGILVGAATASRVLPTVGPRKLMVGGMLAAAVACGWLTQIGVSTSFAVYILPAEIVIGTGFGLAFVPMSSTALIGVGPHDAGVASATLNMSQQVGGSLGTALLNTLYATAAASFLAAHAGSVDAVARSEVHGYTVGFWVSAVVLAVAAVVAFVFTRAGKTAAAGPGGHQAAVDTVF